LKGKLKLLLLLLLLVLAEGACKPPHMLLGSFQPPEQVKK